MKLQVTYFCESGKYKPISTTLDVPSSYTYIKNKDFWHEKAKRKIKSQRCWTEREFVDNDYTIVKARFVKD